MTRSLVWFRNDLRTLDHAPLVQAAASSQVFALYCFDPKHFGKTSFGFDQTGSHRVQFLRQSVEDLRVNLRRLGGELIVRMGNPSAIIGELMEGLKIDQLVFHQEVGTEEQTVQDAVETTCQEKQVRFEGHWGATLHSPSDLPFEIQQLPELFTHFRKQVEASSRPVPPLAEPDRIQGELPADFDIGQIPTQEALNAKQPPADTRRHREYQGGQTGGLARLNDYVWRNDRLRIYKKTRNGMLAVDDSSKLSLWLANGCLSPRTIAAEVDAYEQERVANDSTYWLIFELLWRDYFRFIMAKHGERLFQVGGLQRIRLPWKCHREEFDLWAMGQTGYPLVDANMQELAATGYMSNRGRQNVASFLTKNLGIDWRMGAQWFESLLIDYDVASNYGNWNYAAGVGNDARGFRLFNILKQSREYDANGEYVRHWLPVLNGIPADHVHQPWTLTPTQQSKFGIKIGKDYPDPMVDLFKSAEANRVAYDQATRS